MAENNNHNNDLENEVHEHDLHDDAIEEGNDLSFQRKKNKIVLIIIILVLGGGAYFLLFQNNSEDMLETDKDKKTRIDKLIKDANIPSQEVAPRIVLQDQQKDSFSLSESLELPSLPSSEIKAPQPLQSLLPPPPNPPVVQGGAALPPPGAAQAPAPARRQGKQSGSMLAISGGNVVSEKDKKDEKEKENRVVDLNVVPDTSSPHNIASRMSDLRATVAQGKIISAVLETAINSDLEGVLRGIITSDVYSELGRNILLPKGSRLIGSYTFSGAFGTSRIGVSWTRIIMPNGFDVNVNALGIDKMGRSGVGGVVDDKFGNILTSTILLAGVSIGTAAAVSKIPGLDSQVTTSTDPTKPGTTSTTTSTSSQIVSQSLNDVSESSKDLIKRYADTKPTIYVDQGTEVRVFVSQDLVFPWETIRGSVKTIR